MSALEYLSIAACGWSPSDWGQQFYPDDLPEDWVQAYYANQFRQVFLAEDILLEHYPALAGWQQEVGEGFEFYLEITPRLQASPAWPVVREFIGQQHANCIIHERGLLADLKAVAARVDLWSEGQLLMECLHQSALPAMQCGLLRTSQPPEPLLLRKWLETLRDKSSAPVFTLFVDAPYALVSQINLMKQIYGWH